MSHPDDYDDTIRNTGGAAALMAAVFECAMLDAADPRYRLSALRWLLSEGAVWAVEFGGADPAAYRERLRAIKVVKPSPVWIGGRDHVLGPLCKRGHEYKNTGMTLRRRYAESNYCPECEAITNREHKQRQKAKRVEVSVSMFIGPLCKRGHEYENSGGSLRYKSSRMCLECDRLSAARRKRYQPRTTADTFLGSLCKRNHDHEGTGQSLRYTGNRHCVECKRATDMARIVVRRTLEEAV